MIFKPPGPVALEFLLSTSPIRIIEGPVESGKSTTSAMALYKAMCEIPKQRDGKRRSRWLVTRNCYDADTEVLAERGWVKFSDLMDGERVAQLRDGKMEFVKPAYYYQAPYRGEMIGFEGEGVDFRVTPDHRMYVSSSSRKNGGKRQWGDYRFTLASEIYGKEEVRVKRDAEWDGNSHGYSVAFFEWLGFWFAEGSTHVQRRDGQVRLLLTQSKQDGIELARRLFRDAQIPHTEHKRDNGVNFYVPINKSTASLRAELAMCGKATTKRVLPWMKNAPPAHLRAFINGFVAGDGHVNKRGVVVAFTSSKQLADDLQEMALRAGMVANVSRRDRRGQAMCVNGVTTSPTAIEYTVTFVGPAKHQPKLRRGGYAQTYRGWYKEHYDGDVFCIEVPTHVIYVRRNGKAFWCSQTYPDLRGSTVETWLNWFPPEHYGRFYDTEPYLHEMRFLDVEADVVFESFLDDSDDVIRSLRSKEYTGGWINETQFFPRRLVFEIATRTGRYPRRVDIAHALQPGEGLSQFLVADLNAPFTEDHWIRYMRGDIPLPLDMPPEERMQYVKPANVQFFKQPSALLEVFAPDGETVRGYEVNPRAENLANMADGVRSTLEMERLASEAKEKGTPIPRPARYIELIGGKPKDEIDRDLMGRVVRQKVGAPATPQFRKERHVTPKDMEPMPGVTPVLGADHGLTPCVIFFQQINGCWIAFDEICGTNIGTDEFAPLVKAKLMARFPWVIETGYTAWGDPQGGWRGSTDTRTPFKLYAAHGIEMRAPAQKDNPEKRLEANRRVLATEYNGHPRLRVHPRCERYIAALDGGAQVRRVKTPDGMKLVEEIVKNAHSHPFEAGQYALWGGGEVKEMLKPANAEARPRIQNAIPKKRRIITIGRRVR